MLCSSWLAVCSCRLQSGFTSYPMQHTSTWQLLPSFKVQTPGHASRQAPPVQYPFWTCYPPLVVLMLKTAPRIAIIHLTPCRLVSAVQAPALTAPMLLQVTAGAESKGIFPSDYVQQILEQMAVAGPSGTGLESGRAEGGSALEALAADVEAYDLGGETDGDGDGEGYTDAEEGVDEDEEGGELEHE